MNTLSQYVLIFSNLPLLATVFYGAVVYRTLGAELRSFALFLFLSGVIELISAVLWFSGLNNLPLLHIYVAAGFACLSMFYRRVLDGFIDKSIIHGMLITFLVYTGLNSLFIQPVFTFNSYALTVESVLVMILSLSTFMLMMNDLVRKKRLGLATSFNWINSGLFIYYSTNLIIFYFGNIITHSFSKEFNLQTWMLHAFFSTVMYFCFFVGLWNRPRR